MIFIIHHRVLNQLAVRNLRCQNGLWTKKRECNMSSGNSASWRGVPITEIYGSQSPWGAPEFPLVSPSYNHAVLYHVQGGVVVGDRPPKPQIGHDKWDQDHVRMPFSNQSLYPVQDSKGETHLKKRWDMIETALSKPIHNSQELAEAILSYNTKFRSIWKFKGLHKFFKDYIEEEESKYFFDVTLPEIAKLALALPKLVQAPIPLLKQHRNRSISLTQQQISSLLANAFFCTFPRRNSRKSTSEYANYPYINFNTYRFYESTDSDSNMEKLKCLCYYFRRVCTKVPVGVVTFQRRSVSPRSCPDWANSDRRIATLPLYVDSHNTIEDASGLIQVDFANKNRLPSAATILTCPSNRFLGGGVLGHGCVQEEIRFVICPELMVSMLFTEVLRPNEALIMIGCERYSNYTGYGHTFQWAEGFTDNTPFDSSGRRRCAVLAIDAVPCQSVLDEYKSITRELNKAWVGFSLSAASGSAPQRPGVASGNWGCGAFGGSAPLKSLLQLMASAQARRPLAYYTFGDVALRDYIVEVYDLLSRYNVTVGQLYKHLTKFSELIQKNVKLKLYPYLEQVLKSDTTPDETNADISASSEIPSDGMDNVLNELCIPETIISIEEDLNSPDLFSQDEMDVSMTESTLLDSNNIQDNKATSKQDLSKETEEKDATCKEIKQDTTLSKKKVGSTNEQKPNRISLFDAVEMEENAGTSPSVPNTSLLGRNRNVSLNGSNLSMDMDVRSDSATKLKRKIERKITDYFCKTNNSNV